VPSLRQAPGVSFSIISRVWKIPAHQIVSHFKFPFHQTPYSTLPSLTQEFRIYSQ
jgi:hypothetical protein